MFKGLRAAYHEYCRSVANMRAIDAALVGGHFTPRDYVELPLLNALRAFKRGANDK